MVQIWHNNRCSKSREAKKILEESNVPHGTFEYLKEEFTKETILDIMKKLNITDIKDMLRKKEDEYKVLNIENKTQNEIIEIILNTPKLIERPIIIKDEKAVIARPMENLINLLKD
jgi:arsenate reductase